MKIVITRAYRVADKLIKSDFPADVTTLTCDHAEICNGKIVTFSGGKNSGCIKLDRLNYIYEFC